MEDKPRIFGAGVFTAAVSMRGMTLYVGTQEIQFVKSMNLEGDAESGVMKLEISFPLSHEPKVMEEIELNMRAARKLPWVVVKQ